MQKIKLIDSGGGFGSVSFEDVASVGEMTDYLADYSLCGVVSGSQSIPLAGIVATTAAAGANVDRKLKIYYKTVAGERGKFEIPAPLPSGTIGKRGERLTGAQGEALLRDWESVNGLGANSLIFVRGSFTQRV